VRMDFIFWMIVAFLLAMLFFPPTPASPQERKCVTLEVTADILKAAARQKGFKIKAWRYKSEKRAELEFLYLVKPDTTNILIASFENGCQVAIGAVGKMFAVAPINDRIIGYIKNATLVFDTSTGEESL
jgi:hypothetical protein